MSTNVGGLDVSRETKQDLDQFASLTTKWTPKINLIAPNTVPYIWDRHIVDSAQIYRFAPDTYTKWVDIGSGGGFPGIVMSILAKQYHPNAQFVLIESDQRKATFLRTAVRELALNAEVLAQRIEEAMPQEADVVSARALTTLSSLIPLAARHMKSTGHAILHKGRQAGQEIANARKSWSFDLEDHASITDPEARLLVIQRISPRDA